MARSWRIAAVAAVLLAGCGIIPYYDMREDFRTKLLCPDDRLTIVERTDLSLDTWACPDPARWVHDLRDSLRGSEDDAVAALRALCTAQPPEDIAIDPERLAIWRATRDDERRDFYARVGTPVQITGCGAQRFFVSAPICRHCGRPQLHELGPPPT